MGRVRKDKQTNKHKMTDIEHNVKNWGDNQQERDEFHRRLTTFMTGEYQNIIKRTLEKKDSKNEELQKYINHYKINIPLLYLYMASRPKEDNYMDWDAPIVENWFSSGDFELEHLEERIEQGRESAKEVAEILQGALNRFHKEPVFEREGYSEYYDFVPVFDEL